MTAHNLQSIPIDDLLPYARNAKQHPPEQIAQIAASIKEFGFNAPVLVDGEKGIIAGHGRVLAARKLGLATVPCIVLTHLSEAQKRAYIIADNRLGDTDLAPWDWEMLQAEIDALKEENYDYTLTGFTDESLAAAVGNMVSWDSDLEDINWHQETTDAALIKILIRVDGQFREELIGAIEQYAKDHKIEIEIAR